MTAHDPALCARLVAEAREDDKSMAPAPWQVISEPNGNGTLVDDELGNTVADCDQPRDDEKAGCVRCVANASAIARTRNNLAAMADQLEAGAREVADTEEQRDVFRDRSQQLAARIAALEAALREALAHWQYPPETFDEKVRKDEIWSLAYPVKNSNQT